jgi:hypothetical protein
MSDIETKPTAIGRSIGWSGQRQSYDASAQVAVYSLATLVLTSVHHVYGAHAFATPWRYHAVYIAGATAAVLLLAFGVYRRRRSGVAGGLAWGLFVLTASAVPVLLFGVIEGGYNHIVKNVLYFGGASAELLARLFPAPTYEMPSDALFEITGVLQVVPAAIAGWYLYRMLRSGASWGSAVAARQAGARAGAR